ncbi:MAG: DUF2059 domain-containing protein [Alphaproteobacteria bacterium]|nr:DUF2059 domain-containing protein [Alphaproteobacteria bacterium]
MRKFLTAAAMALTLVMPAFAADQDIAPERLALAKQLMELSGATKVYDNFDKNLDVMLNQMLQGSHPDEATIADLKKIAVEEFNADRPQMMDGAVKIYARHFTEDDLRALITFYKSDAGQHFAAELPVVSQECIQLDVPFMQHLMARVKQYIADKAAAQKAAPEQEKSSN